MPTTIVEEPKTEATTRDPDAEKSTFGNIVLEKKSAPKLEEKTQVEEPPAPTKPEPAKEPPKEPPKEAPPATTPIGDVLDAALSKAPLEPTKEPAASPIDEFADVTDGVKSEKVRERMVGMRGKIKTLWEENQTLSRERADLQSKVKPALEDPEVQRLIKARDEELSRANEALLALNIDSHPEFQREFIQPREKLAKSAAQKLQAYGGNGQALLDALYMPEGIRRDEALAQLLENVPDYARSKITNVVTQIEGLDDKAQEKRANAPRTWEELKTRDTEVRRKKAEEYRGQVKSVYEEVTRELSELPFFRELSDDIKGASEWNNRRKAAFERGLNHILGSDNTLKGSLTASIKGEDYDNLAKMLVEERTLRRAAEKRNAEYEGVQPTVRGGPAPAGKETDEPEKNEGFGDFVARSAAARRSAEAD